jgi:hypothetical protein
LLAVEVAEVAERYGLSEPITDTLCRSSAPGERRGGSAAIPDHRQRDALPPAEVHQKQRVVRTVSDLKYLIEGEQRWDQLARTMLGNAEDQQVVSRARATPSDRRELGQRRSRIPQSEDRVNARS